MLSLRQVRWCTYYPIARNICHAYPTILQPAAVPGGEPRHVVNFDFPLNSIVRAPVQAIVVTVRTWEIQGPSRREHFKQEKRGNCTRTTSCVL